MSQIEWILSKTITVSGQLKTFSLLWFSDFSMKLLILSFCKSIHMSLLHAKNFEQLLARSLSVRICGKKVRANCIRFTIGLKHLPFFAVISSEDRHHKQSWLQKKATFKMWIYLQLPKSSDWVSERHFVLPHFVCLTDGYRKFRHVCHFTSLIKYNTPTRCLVQKI